VLREVIRKNEQAPVVACGAARGAIQNNAEASVITSGGVAAESDSECEDDSDCAESRVRIQATRMPCSLIWRHVDVLTLIWSRGSGCFV
jgi:hypothetical protein